MISLVGCDEGEVDLFGVTDNILSSSSGSLEELKNIDIENLTQDELIEIVNNISLEDDIQKMEKTIGVPFMDFMKQLANTELDATKVNPDRYMELQEAIEELKKVKFDISNIENWEQMTLDELISTTTGFSIEKAFESWGPGGVIISDTIEKMYRDTVDGTKEAIDSSLNAIKSAIGNKTGQESSEVTQEDVMKYIEDELKKNGYDSEGAKKVINDTLNAISDEMTDEQKQVMDLFIHATEGITEEDEEADKQVLNKMLDNIEQDLTPEQVKVLRMLREVGTVLGTYDYKSGDAQTFINNLFDAIGTELTPEQKELLQMFKRMI